MRSGTGLGVVLAVALGATAARGFNPEFRPISAIQGASHLSPLLGRRVKTEGVVTAILTDGFYMQDPVGDGDPATSEGLFVEVSPGDAAAGDRLRVTGTVAEAAPAGPPEGLPLTRMTGPSVEVVSRGNPLPRPVVIGAGGLSMPRGAVVSPSELPVDLRDSAQARVNRFNPDTDVLDFLEALEGMLVTLRRPSVLSPSESRGAGRSDLYVHPDPGPAAHDRHVGTAAGGLLLRSGPDNLGDQNQDRLRVAFDPALHPGPGPVLAVGDRTGDITGVVDYAYGAFQVRPITPVAVTARSRWRPQVTALRRGPARLTIATYNVLNLSADSSDDVQRQRLGAQIVRALRVPDILALQEIQDASGERDDGIVDARPTLGALAKAVLAAGGPTYLFFDVPPADRRPGGAPGGNIRNAFLYDPARVKLVSYRSLTPAILSAAGAPRPTAFAESRDPLEAVFEFSGRRLTVINNHLSSRYGSTPVFGAVQPWVQAGEAEREAQVRALRAYLGALVRADAGAQVVVLGDMNTFEGSDDLSSLLPGVPPLVMNLILRVPQPERYSYIFEGNSQALDHVFVTRNLAAHAEADVVHVNVDFPSNRPASDHDPVVAGFRW